jgi:glycosyltransferase involved in cell wall biosynthesis
MKIAYVSTYDSDDIHNWSGTGYYIKNTLKQQGFEVITIGSLNEKMVLFFKAKSFYYKKILKKNYLRDREPFLLKYYSKQVEQSLLNCDYDIVFSPGTIPIAYLNCNKPIIFWTDATFAGMVNFYPSFSKLDIRTIKNGNNMEQLSLTRCHTAIYASDWAAKSAIDNYNVNPEKIKVLPFGANFVSALTFNDLKIHIINKDYNTCKLLFIGVDWDRKNGDLVVETAKVLRDMGINVELHIVGCEPDINQPFIIKHGFLSKNNEKQRNILYKLFLNSHFLFVPSKSECYGVVFAEASSFGLPSISTNVGGIPTVINDGINGKLFNLSTSPNIIAEFIKNCFLNRDYYIKLSLSSYEEYILRLNWEVIGEKLKSIIESVPVYKRNVV